MGINSLTAGVLLVLESVKNMLWPTKNIIRLNWYACDFDQGLNHFQSAFPDVNTFSNDQSILGNDDIDIVSIASYDNFHSSQILQALERNKTCYV